MDNYLIANRRHSQKGCDNVLMKKETYFHHMESKVTTENRELSKLYIKVKDQEPIFRQHIHKTMKI